MSFRRPAARRSTARLAAHALLLLVGAGVARAQVPAARDAARDAAAPAESRVTRRSCRDDVCRSTLTVAGHRMEGESRRARFTDREVLDGWRRSRARRFLGGMREDLRRDAGHVTHETWVTHTTWSFTEAGGPLRLACQVVRIDDEQRRRATFEEDDDPEVVDGMKVTTTLLHDGTECVATSATDTTAVRWRIRRGVSPARDSVAWLVRARASVPDSVTAALRGSRRFVLERAVAGADGGVVSYPIVGVYEGGVMMRLPDRAPAGLRHPGTRPPVNGEIDFSAGADLEEAAFLRLLAVLLLQAPDAL